MRPRPRTTLIRGATAAVLLLLLFATACDGDSDAGPVPVQTQIVLAVVPPEDGPPSANALSRTGELVSRRFVAAELAEPHLATADAELRLTVAGEVSPELVESLVVPGELRFRKVLETNSGGEAGEAAPGEVEGTRAERTAAVAETVGEAAMAAAAELVAGDSGPETMEQLVPFGELTGAEVAVLPVMVQFAVPTISCAQLDARPYGAISARNELAVACDEAGTRFLLDLAPLQGSDLADARAVPVHGEFVVTMDFTGEGQTRWTELTREAASNSGEPFDPTAVSTSNRYQGSVPIGCPATGDTGSCLVAIVQDNRVITAPEILSVINGPAQVTGDFPRDDAKLLAAQLQTGPLPVVLDVISVTTEPVGPPLPPR